MHLFVPPSTLPLRPRHALPPAQRSVSTRVTPTASGRSPWPLTRFVQTALFYSPLGRILRGEQADPAATLSRTKRSRKQPNSPPMRGIVLVTGASGGTGRRVVRELLAANTRVRAITRGRERLQAALADVGVNMQDEEKKGTLQVIVSDLYNLRSEFFEEVTGVASCTGTRVGPSEDPDRKKYFQGIKFYPPVVNEDTPENVEYVGVRNLVQMAKAQFESSPDNVDAMDLMMFDDEAKLRATWGQLDDIVMGGVSQSNISAKDGALVFSGFVSTDNFGGFASARTVDFTKPLNLNEFDGLQLRVRGDGKSYKFIVRCEKKWDGKCHCFTFPTTSGVWTTVNIPFSSFNTVFRAKTVNDGKPIEKGNVVALQLMLSKFEYDGELNPNFTAGPFELSVSSIKAYKNTSDAVYPKFVHVSSAAVTRVLRKNEFKEEELPKIVQLNEALGRLLEWKFAGEDTIRESGIPYCVLRACALTEKEPLGLDALDFQQGDFITGQVARDDIASLFVEAFSNPALVNVTTEITQLDEGSAPLGPAEGRISKLAQDAEDTRPYASFPFVPAKDAVGSS